MIVLGLTTSTARGGVALLVQGSVAASECYLDSRAHGERLFGAIDAAALRAGVDKARFEALGCDVGPGSFTGLRVALAAAHGIAIALGIPVVGVGSLEAMACAASELLPQRGTILAMVDAHKEQVFAASFVRQADGSLLQLGEPVALGLAAAAEAAQLAHARGELLVGEIVDALAPGLAFRDPSCDLPDAGAIARLAASRLASGAPRSVGIHPVYGREPDAKPLGSA